LRSRVVSTGHTVVAPLSVRYCMVYSVVYGVHPLYGGSPAVCQVLYGVLCGVWCSSSVRW
jgi:hypothetical protein